MLTFTTNGNNHGPHRPLRPARPNRSRNSRSVSARISANALEPVVEPIAVATPEPEPEGVVIDWAFVRARAADCGAKLGDIAESVGVSPSQFRNIQTGFRKATPEIAAKLEQGFTFGRSRGVVEGVLGAAGVPVTIMMTPAAWKRAVNIPPGAAGAKDVARSEAVRRWPARASLFARKRDDGRAEAGLIAVAGLMKGRI